MKMKPLSFKRAKIKAPKSARLSRKSRFWEFALYTKVGYVPQEFTSAFET
jgi:hypothetical protein